MQDKNYEGEYIKVSENKMRRIFGPESEDINGVDKIT
jgi:hypothetical protein